MSTPILEYRNFSKTYKNGRRAVDSLSLQVMPGDIYGFIGQNGAGKTTSLRSAAGVLDFTEGDILINGVSINADPVACKKITAYIPDNPDIYEYLTGQQYLNFISDIYSVPDRESVIGRYAEEFTIADRLGGLISSYSHGMRQKTAIIAELIHDPKLMLLDEPFVGLDPMATFTLRKRLTALCESGGAVFFSTHILEVAQKFCNKIAVIKAGRLVASGDTEEVCGSRDLEAVFMELQATEE